MLPTLRVHLLPELFAASDSTREVAVVIDVLRATTTIAQALHSGAAGVIPCERVEDARLVAAKQPDPAAVVLGGERGGLPIEGFHLGNSPAEYTAEAVGGKTVVITTTNGTRALAACRDAQRLFTAAAVDRRAVCDLLRRLDAQSIDLVCAGTNGKVTREDILIAGAIVEGLLDETEPGEASLYAPGDAARVAWDAWRNVVADAQGEGVPLEEHLARELCDTGGGANLLAIDHEADLKLAARLDSIPLVPVMNRLTGWITPSERKGD